MNIQYREIWNEVDDGLRQSQMWTGTADDYYRLYEITSQKLKKRFPDIKVGGYAATGFNFSTTRLSHGFRYTIKRAYTKKLALLLFNILFT